MSFKSTTRQRWHTADSWASRGSRASTIACLQPKQGINYGATTNPFSTWQTYGDMTLLLVYFYSSFSLLMNLNSHVRSTLVAWCSTSTHSYSPMGGDTAGFLVNFKLLKVALDGGESLFDLLTLGLLGNVHLVKHQHSTPHCQQLLLVCFCREYSFRVECVVKVCFWTCFSLLSWISITVWEICL